MSLYGLAGAVWGVLTLLDASNDEASGGRWLRIAVAMGLVLGSLVMLGYGVRTTRAVKGIKAVPPG